MTVVLDFEVHGYPKSLGEARNLAGLEICRPSISGNTGPVSCVTSPRGEKGHPLTTLAYDVLLEPDQGWRADAACRDLDIDIFFPVDESEEAAMPAKAICATCPVSDVCLQYALATNQAEGVWGGLDANERRRMRRRIRDQARRKAS